AAASSRQADGDDAELPTSVDRSQHARRAAAGRDRERDVAASAERLDLPREHLGVAAVVGDARDRRRVGGQREGRQGGAIEAEAIYELGRQMLRVGGAAAVAEEKERIAGGERIAGHLDDFCQRDRLRIDEAFLRRAALREDSPDLVPHGPAPYQENGL